MRWCQRSPPTWPHLWAASLGWGHSWYGSGNLSACICHAGGGSAGSARDGPQIRQQGPGMFGPSPYALPLSNAKSTAGRPPIVRAVRSSNGSLSAGGPQSRMMSSWSHISQESTSQSRAEPAGVPAVPAEQQHGRQHGQVAIQSAVGERGS